MNFSVNCLEIIATKEEWKKNKSLYKNLLSENDYKNFEEEKVRKNEAFKKRFFFNDFYEHNQHGGLEKNKNYCLNSNVFFEEGINIQAIVGKNGSGKSTLMDLMYMAVNNFAFFFEQGKARPGADELCYVQGLFLNLYFSVENEDVIHEYKLECKEITKLLKREKGGWPIVCCASFRIGKTNKYYKKRSDKPIISLVENFFYTIVSNYSMQSFISSNYIERTQDYEGRNQRKPWINSIFYKNDGYVRPIVLNPFRKSGTIDLANEQNLSKDRATSLFVYAFYGNDGEKKFFRPYCFADLKIKYENAAARNKINKIIVKNKKNVRLFASNQELLEFVDNSASFIHLLEQRFFFKLENQENKKICVAYVMFKIWNLTQRYVFYSLYKDVIDFNEEGFFVKNRRSATAFFNRINRDNSHVTKKIKRSLNYLLIRDDLGDSFCGIKYFQLLRKTYIQKVCESEKKKGTEYLYFKEKNPFAIGEKLSFISPGHVDLCLPPPIFSYELILKGEETSKNKKIAYGRLSSGELQLLQTLSVHAYHIANLLSVQEKNRPRYRNINLIFDEVEICFHPEYQRNFVNRLVEMTNDMKWTDSALVNIFLLTHSPFILSDLPSSNVLYLKDGSMDEASRTNSFAGNIGEMFSSNFFMDDTIGAYATKKLNEIIKADKKNISEKKLEDYEKIIDSVGDSILKKLLWDKWKYNEKI